MKEIPQSQVLERIRFENPWWQSGQIDSHYAKMSPRAYFELFDPLVRDVSVRRAVVLMGPRRVGKTVLIHHVIQRLIQSGIPPRKISYIPIENPVYNGLGLEQLFAHCRMASGDEDLRGHFLFFDEIQYLRDWEVHLKSLVDSYHDVKCVASGSAAAALRLKSIESGAGRFTDFLLPPLTFHEYLALAGQSSLIDPERAPWDTTSNIDALNEAFVGYLNYGGYPEAVVSPQIRSNPERFIRGDIIDKVLLRDLPSLYGISDIQELNSLFTMLAFNTAQEVSLEQLSQRSGVAKNTIKRYIEYLEAAFLIRRIHRVDRTARRFQRATTFKVYLTTPSIRSALFSPVSAESAEMGSLVETAVFSQWFHYELSGNYHYARWSTGEVDLVSLDGRLGAAWAVEVKWSDRIQESPGELRALAEFCKAHGLRKPVVTTRTISGTRVIDGLDVELVPAALYCHTIGRNVVRSKDLRRRFFEDPAHLATGRQNP